MKKILLIAIVVAAFYVGYEITIGFRQFTTLPATQTSTEHSSSSNAVQAAFNEPKPRGSEKRRLRLGGHGPGIYRTIRWRKEHLAGGVMTAPGWQS